jgi:hypothetical protein
VPDDRVSDSPDDAAVTALTDLIATIEQTVAELNDAIDRAHHVTDLRTSGLPWLDIVHGEERPLVIERVSRALTDLGAAGNNVRREQARALLREGLSVTEISRLFGVTRQRVSALLQAAGSDDPPRTS